MAKNILEDFQRAMTLKNAAIQACHEQRYADSARLGSESLVQESAWVCAQAAIHQRVLSFSVQPAPSLHFNLVTLFTHICHAND